MSPMSPMRTRPRATLALAVALASAVLAGHGVARAQVVLDETERLNFDRPESWAYKYFTSVVMLPAFGAPARTPAGSVRIGFEAANVPSLSEEQRRVGFDGNKVEDLNRTDAVGRLQVRVGLPGDVAVTVGYVPPVELDGVEPELYSLAVERPVWSGRAARVGLRLHGHVGTFRGDFTCTAAEAAAGDDIDANPFGCEAPSRDELTTRYIGLEAAAAFRPGRRVEPFVAVSGNRMDLEFQVDARYSGLIDRMKHTTEGWTHTLAAGTAVHFRGRASLALEAFWAPLEIARAPDREPRSDDLVQVRALLAFRLR